MQFGTACGKAVRCTCPSNVHLCKHSMTGLSHKKNKCAIAHHLFYQSLPFLYLFPQTNDSQEELCSHHVEVQSLYSKYLTFTTLIDRFTS